MVAGFYEGADCADQSLVAHVCLVCDGFTGHDESGEQAPPCPRAQGKGLAPSGGVQASAPFPRCVRVSPFLMVYASLPTRFFLVAHAITTGTLGTTGTPLPYRFPFYRDTCSRQS